MKEETEMADGNKVTIDVAWFDELRSAASGERRKILEAAYNQVCKDRDELKAALDTANANNSAQAEQLRDALNEIEAMKVKLVDMSRHDAIAISDSRLEAAERCIEDIEHIRFGVAETCQGLVSTIRQIIRAYREKMGGGAK